MMQKMLSGSQANPSGMSEIMAEMQKAEQAADVQRQADIEEDRRMQEKLATQSRGKSRDDLQRFVGFYGEPNRNWYSPDPGLRLVLSHLWASEIIKQYRTLH